MRTAEKRLERIEKGLGPVQREPVGRPVILTIEEAELLASAHAKAEENPGGEVEYSPEEIALLRDLEARRNAKYGVDPQSVFRTGGAS